jgi:phage replication O-like protein O
MSGFEKQTYTQVPNSLFEIMHEMDECELKVVLYICRYTFGYHRDEVKISTRKLANAIKMSVASVDKGANAAVDRGLIERITDGQNTTIWRAIVSDSENESPDTVLENETPVTQKMNRSVPDNESQVGVKERIKKAKKSPSLNFKDMTVAEARKVPSLRMYIQATDHFPGSVVWEYVHNTITQNNLTFEKLQAAAVEWSARGFKPSNVKGVLEWAINGIPSNGYAAKPADTAPRPEYLPVQPDPNKDKYVPRPNHIPRPAIKSAPALGD